MELWIGLLLVGLFLFMYIKSRRQYRGMRERRRKILNRFRQRKGSSDEDNKNSKK